MNYLPVGTKIQSPKTVYTITGVLGAGGFGITYSATCTMLIDNCRTKMIFALKEHFVKADCQRDDSTICVMYSRPARERVERSMKDFVGEARRLSRISGKHPGIVTVSEVFEANNTAYYAMEMLEGESLRDYIETHGPVTEGEMLSIMLPIVDAVAFLHKEFITHLDIKPQNIMLATDVDDQQRPVLIDFGLSKHYDEDGNATSTINTQGYSDGYAPMEQYTGIRTFSPASDVYSLAATMFFCLTGRRLPTASELYPEVLEKELPKNISSELREILKGALSQRRDHRPKDGAAFRELFERKEDSTKMVHAPYNDQDEIEEPDIAEIAEIEVEQEVQNEPEARRDEVLENDTEPKKKRHRLIPVTVGGLVLVGCAISYLATNSSGGKTNMIAEDTMPATVAEAEVPESIKAHDELIRQLRVEEALKEAEKGKNISQADFIHSQPKNFDLCVTRNGKTGYISEAVWQQMTELEKNQYSKRGIYLSNGSQHFLLALTDLQSGRLSWNEAMSKYGNQLPTKDQGDVMVKNKDVLKRILLLYEGKRMSGDYWTSTSNNSNSNNAWCVNITGGYSSSHPKGDSYKVRAVVPVPLP